MSKKEKLMEAWKPKISRVALNALAEGDKTPTTKYLEFMYKVWHRTRPFPSYQKPKTTKELIKYVNEFDKLLPYMEIKDIFYHQNSWVSLVSAIGIAQEKKEDKEFKREEHIQVVVENDDYILLRPITHKGSLKYGANTRWCTASKHNESTFISYFRGGYLYYLLKKRQKKNVWDKIAFFLPSHANGVLMNPIQTFCSQDVNHNTNSLMNSDLDLETLTTIHYYIRFFSVSLHKKKLAKDKIDQISKYLNKIDIKEIHQSFKLLNVKEEDYNETLNRLALTIESFNEKLKL